MTSLIIFLIFFASSCTSNELKNFKEDRTIVYTDYGSNSYLRSNVDEYINVLKSLKSKQASLLYTCYTENITSSKISCDSYDSPKRSRLIRTIQKLQKQDFTVSLRIYVDLKSNDWRAKWDPENKKQVFLNLKSVLLDFASLAEDHNINNYIIGSEYEKLTRPQYSSYWIDIINQIKKIYSGKIIYAANGNISTYKEAEYQWIDYWKHLGSIGINHYPHYKGNPTFALLSKNHFSFIKKYQQIASKWKLPIYYTEVGFPLSAKGYRDPYQWIWDKSVGKSKKLQILNIKSFLKAIKQTKYTTIYFWRHMPSESDTHPQGYLISDEPTLRLIQDELDNIDNISR